MTTNALLQQTTNFDDRARLVITDPRDDSPVGSLPMTDPGELSELVEAARAAFSTWSMMDAAARSSCLKLAALAIAENEHELAETNERETGRPYDEALAGVIAGADTLLQYAEIGPLHQGDRLLGSASAIDYSIPEPRGVVAVITPWNDPVAIALGLIGAATVMGNTVIHKPSERCPHLGELLGRILASAFPDGVVTTVTGDATVGAALASSRVDVIAHVGSTEAGDHISRVASLGDIHVIRENGGNDALIVDAGIDPVWAAEQAAIGAFANVGQICTSVERILVHRDIADAFTRALVAEADRWTARLAPLVDGRMRDAVHEQVAASVAAGAVALTGGFLPEGAGSYYPVTVLAGCAPDMPVMTQETFGPVAPLMVVDSFEQAISVAALDTHGLAATVLTSSMVHASDAARLLPVGTVKINAVFGGAPGGSAQPRGASGAGFGYGPRLLDEMTRMKVVHIGLPGGRS